MKISYEIYNNTPYVVSTNMHDSSCLDVFVTRGDAISIKFAGNEKRFERGHARFDALRLKDGAYRPTLFTSDGAYELLPIVIEYGVAKTDFGEHALTTLFTDLLLKQKQIDELTALCKKIENAVFGSKIL